MTGAWAESTGGDISWQLTQTGSSVSGTSRFSQNNGLLGAATGRGTISGTVANGTFTFTDSYPTGSLSVPNCSIVVTGTLTFSGNNQMSGRYSALNSCNGGVLGTETGSMTMRR